MTRVFFDTSAQLALISPQDQDHHKAKSIFKRLKKHNVTLVMSDYVFDELLTAITTRIGKTKAIEYSKKFPAGDITLVFTEKEDFFQAKHLFERYQDKQWSFTDSVSFAMMKRFGIKDALSFDRHFSQAGFNLLK